MKGELDVLSAVDTLRQSLRQSPHRVESEDDGIDLIFALTHAFLNEVLQYIENAICSENALIRCQASEFFGELWSEGHNDMLLERLASDEDWLVRRAAAVSLAQRRVVAAMGQIEGRLAEAEAEERVGLYYAAYRLTGESKYFMKFIVGVHHEHYRVRCATCNLLLDVVDDCNRDLVKYLVETQLRMEDSEAAREALQEALRCLQAVSSPVAQTRVRT